MKKFKLISFLFLMIISLGIFCSCSKRHIHDWVEIDKTTATCVEDGKITFLCHGCDETKVIVMQQATGHIEVIDQAVEATCTETGLTEGKHCSKCNEVLIAQEEVAPLGHSHSTDWSKDATGHWHACACGDIVEKISHTSGGPATEEADEVCTVCGYVIAPKLNHEHTYNVKVENEYTLKEEATCTENAIYYYSCRCNEISTELTYEKEDSALGHTDAAAVKENEILSTCKVAGSYDSVVYCSVCKTEISREEITLPLANHKEEVIVGKAATCTETGLTEGKKCSVCDEVLVAQEVIATLGHSYIAAVTNPTCITQGYTTHTCVNCNDICVDTYVNALGHTEVIDAAVASTCTETGLTEGKHCLVCEEVLVEQKVIATLGHDYSEIIYVWNQEYTILTAARTCLNDKNHIETETVSVTYAVKKIPTCESEGKGIYTSSSFENEAFEIQTYEITLEKTAHSYKSVAATEPTCEETGIIAHYECENCDQVFILENNEYKEVSTIIDPALGHKEVIDKAIEPTCTEKGLTEGKHCLVCKEVLVKQEEVDASGHDDAGVCSKCGTKFYTEGLKYSFYENNCTVEGIGESEDTEIIIPSIYKGYTVTSISSTAFDGCTNITKIVIPDSVTRLESGTLADCINLESLTLPKVTGDYSSQQYFGYLFAATSYETQKDKIPHSLKEIIITKQTELPNFVFYGCSNIESIILPDSFEHFGYLTFYDCTSLKGIEYENAIYIGSNENPYMTLIRAKNKDIESCTINENTIFIIDNAFVGCSKLKSIVIPSNVKYIYGGCFGSSGLEKVYYKGDIEDWCNLRFPDLYYDACSPMLYANTIYMLDENNEYYEVKGEIVIPDTITAINSHQFIGFNNITKVIIPNTIEHIGNSAFEDCFSLETVEIPGSVKTIDFDAFRDCEKLQTITFNEGLESIYEYAFSNCYSLTEAILPEGIDYVGYGAFESCSELKKLYIPKDIKEVEFAILHWCQKVEYINVPYFSSSYNYDGAYLGMLFNAPSADTQDDYIPATLKEVIVTNEDKFHNYAFYGCNNLESLTVPFIGGEKDNNKNSYLGYVFGASSYNSQNDYIPNTLKKVVFNDGNEISEYSFYGCSSIEIIEIPNTVKKICSNAFSNENLHTVYFNGTIEEWFEIEFETTPMHYADNLYLKNENGEYYEPIEVVVPDTITNLSYQLYGINSLVSVTIPETVTNIMYSALYECNNLESLTLPFIKSVGTDYSSTKYNIIGGLFGAYQYKDNETYVPSTLKNVIITNQAELDSYAFYGCSSILNVELPTNLTKIGNSAFYNCSSLESIIIPDSVIDLGQNSFYDCVNLGYIKLSENITEIKYSTFDGCSSLEYINLPDGIGKIDTYAFYYCSKLKEIKLPANLTTIGNNAFEKCNSLKDICINGKITSIGNKAFSGCSKITNIYYNGSIENWSKITMTSSTSNPMYHADNLYIVDNYGDIEYNGQKYTLLRSLVIPANITNIKSYFVVGDVLQKVIIHKDVTTVESSAFYNCENITIYCEAPSKPEGWSVSWSPSTSPIYWGVNSNSFIAIDGVEYIAIDEDEVSLIRYVGEGSELIIPATVKIENTTYNVTSIGKAAFKECKNLESVLLPNTLTNIGDKSFYNCSNLASLVIPNSVIKIGSNAFYGCNSLTSITLPFVGNALNGTTNTYFGYIFGATSYSYNQAYIPTTLEEVNITGGTSIYENAFYGCSSLKSITLPNTLTTMGNKSFYNCSNIENIVIPNSVTNLGSGAFYGCNSLTSITLPFVGNTLNGTTNTHFGYIFGANTYASNSYNVPSSLKEVVVTKGTNISNDAFHGCDDITSVTLPNTVTSIGEYAFYGCSSMTNITLPDKLSTIGKNAFYNCSNIENVVIPNTVTSIGEWAFCGCSKLEWVVIFDSLTDMASYVFYNCKNLKIYIKADSIPVNWASNWNTSGLPVYLKGQWEYDSNGNPVPLS